MQSYILMGSSRCKRGNVEMIAVGYEQEGYTPLGVKEGLLK